MVVSPIIVVERFGNHADERLFHFMRQSVLTSAADKSRSDSLYHEQLLVGQFVPAGGQRDIECFHAAKVRKQFQM